MTNPASTALIALLVIGWIFYRQLQARPLKERAAKVALIIIAIGGVQAFQFVSHGGEVGIGHAVAAALGLVVAVALAYPRAATTRVFPGPDGAYLRQGSVVTIAIWIAAIAAHVAIDVVVPAMLGDHSGHGFAGATLMLYLGVTLFAQNWFLEQRVAAHRTRALTPA